MTSIGHIAIAVADLENAIEVYKIILGCNPETVEEVADQKVRVAVFRPSGKKGGAIELICPTEDNTSLKAFLDSRGEGLHHISLHVDNVAARLAELKKRGFRLIDESPRAGAEDKKIAFIHPGSTCGVLMELEQE